MNLKRLTEDINVDDMSFLSELVSCWLDRDECENFDDYERKIRERFIYLNIVEVMSDPFGLKIEVQGVITVIEFVPSEDGISVRYGCEDNAKSILSALSPSKKEILKSMANICFDHFKMNPETGDEYSDRELEENEEYLFLKAIMELK